MTTQIYIPIKKHVLINGIKYLLWSIVGTDSNQKYKVCDSDGITKTLPISDNDIIDFIND